MAEETQQPSPNPITTDPEAPSQPNNNPQKKKRRRKCYAFIAAFAILLTITILVFSLTYLRMERPKVRLGRVTVQNSTNFIGNKRLSAQLIVKNSNFVKYEFGPNDARLISGGVIVGQFSFPDGRANARSTESVGIRAEFSGPSGGDGDVVVSARGTLHGKAWVMKVFIRRRSSVMDCSFSLNFTTNVVQGLTCR